MKLAHAGVRINVASSEDCEPAVRTGFDADSVQRAVVHTSELACACDGPATWHATPLLRRTYLCKSSTAYRAALLMAAWRR